MPNVKGRRWTAAEGSFVDLAGETGMNPIPDLKPGDFQFQDMGYEAIDDPAAAIAQNTAERVERGSSPNGHARVAFACPNRPGHPCSFGHGVLIGHPSKPAISPSWQWNGNVEAPTLTPSINCTGGCGWHGFLTDGEFRS